MALQSAELHYAAPAGLEEKIRQSLSLKKKMNEESFTSRRSFGFPSLKFLIPLFGAAFVLLLVVRGLGLLFPVPEPEILTRKLFPRMCARFKWII